MGLLRRQSSTECAAAVGALAALALYFRRRRRDITLTYLDAKGSAEATRLALTIGRVPFRDERLSYNEVALLRDELPFGQVPTLRVGDELYCQYFETWDDKDAGNHSFEELYDIARDPWQLNNTAPSAPPARLQALRARLTALRTCEGGAACAQAAASSAH